MAVDDKKTTEDTGVADGDAGVSVTDDAGAAGDGPVGEDRVGEGGVDLDDDAIVEADAPADELVDYHDNDGHNAIVDFIDSTKGKVIMGSAVAVFLLGGFFAINHFGEGDVPEEGASEIAAPASLSPDQIADRGAMSGRETERSNLNTSTPSRSANVTTPSSSPRRGVAEGRNETATTTSAEPYTPKSPARNTTGGGGGSISVSTTVRGEPIPLPEPSQPQQPATTPEPAQPKPQQPAPPQPQQQQPQPAPSVTTVYQTPDRDR